MIVILHLGSHSGRGHSICSHPLFQGYLRNPGGVSRLGQGKHTDTTHPSPPSLAMHCYATDPSSLLPAARLMVIVGKRTDVGKSRLKKLCGAGNLAKRTGPGSTPCACGLCWPRAGRVPFPSRYVRCGRWLLLASSPARCATWLRAIFLNWNGCADLASGSKRIITKTEKDSCHISDIRTGGQFFGWLLLACDCDCVYVCMYE